MHNRNKFIFSLFKMIKTKYTIFCIFLIVMLSFSKLAVGQINSQQEIDSLICKPWKLKIYEVNGNSQVMDTLSSDRMIFYIDHSLEFVSGNEIIQKASWLDIPVILTPYSGHVDPPTGSWF